MLKNAEKRLKNAEKQLKNSKTGLDASVNMR